MSDMTANAIRVELDTNGLSNLIIANYPHFADAGISAAEKRALVWQYAAEYPSNYDCPCAQHLTGFINIISDADLLAMANYDLIEDTAFEDIAIHPKADTLAAAAINLNAAYLLATETDRIAVLLALLGNANDVDGVVNADPEVLYAICDNDLTYDIAGQAISLAFARLLARHTRHHRYRILWELLGNANNGINGDDATLDDIGASEGADDVAADPTIPLVSQRKIAIHTVRPTALLGLLGNPTANVDATTLTSVVTNTVSDATAGLVTLPAASARLLAEGTARPGTLKGLLGNPAVNADGATLTRVGANAVADTVATDLTLPVASAAILAGCATRTGTLKGLLANATVNADDATLTRVSANAVADTIAADATLPLASARLLSAWTDRPTVLTGLLANAGSGIHSDTAVLTSAASSSSATPANLIAVLGRANTLADASAIVTISATVNANGSFTPAVHAVLLSSPPAQTPAFTSFTAAAAGVGIGAPATNTDSIAAMAQILAAASHPAQATQYTTASRSTFSALRDQPHAVKLAVESGWFARLGLPY